MDNGKKYLRISIYDNDFSFDRELFDMILKMFQNAGRPIREEDVPAIKKFVLEVWPKFLQLTHQVNWPHESLQPHQTEENIREYIAQHLHVEIVGEDRFVDFDNYEDILIPMSAEKEEYVFVK